MMKKLTAFLILLLICASGLAAGELDTILSRYLTPKARGDLSRLTGNLEKLEKEYLDERIKRSTSSLAASGLPARISETESAVGELVRGSLQRVDARGWDRLRLHVIRRYETGFLSREDIEKIETALPAASRRSVLVAGYSAGSFLREAERLRVPVAAVRERISRLDRFTRVAPDLVFLLSPSGFFRAGGYSDAEKKLYAFLLSSAGTHTVEDWRDLERIDPFTRSLVRDRFPLFAAQGTKIAMETSFLLGVNWSAYRSAAERLVLVSRPGEVTREPAPPVVTAQAEADEVFRRNSADGKDIADRVMALFAAGRADDTPAARMAVLELLNHRFAGRMFLSLDKYLPVRDRFISFLDRLYRDTDERTMLFLSREVEGRGTSGIVIREPARDLVIRENFTIRIICIYREEADEKGFPLPFEVDPREAREAYARAFWTITQGTEPDVAPEAVEEWALAHGQMIIPLPLYNGLLTSGEIGTLFLDSHPVSAAGNYPDYVGVFDGLARELVFPWFKWSYRITFPLLRSEYRARGFEALLLADRMVSGLIDSGTSRPESFADLYGSAERVKTTSVLDSLRNLELPLSAAEKALDAAENLPRATDRLIEVFRESYSRHQADFFRSSKEEEMMLSRRIEGLRSDDHRFPSEAAAILGLLNDFLGEYRLSGSAFLGLRGRLLDRSHALFAERGEESLRNAWLDGLSSARVISGRERAERSGK